MSSWSRTPPLICSTMALRKAPVKAASAASAPPCCAPAPVLLWASCAPHGAQLCPAAALDVGSSTFAFARLPPPLTLLALLGRSTRGGDWDRRRGSTTRGVSGAAPFAIGSTGSAADCGSSGSSGSSVLAFASVPASACPRDPSTEGSAGQRSRPARAAPRRDGWQPRCCSKASQPLSSCCTARACARTACSRLAAPLLRGRPCRHGGDQFMMWGGGNERTSAWR
mmetsp:Transcript_16738/g.23040  ORF Transcript_16738/g.23040 Transcript_16738/m.23040 type:complete len:225 (+) Transcript_16738:322-996(+)